ncbi:MAG: MBL fold metallo-hydrolase, partial [Ruminococcus sp.]|nr:MBL fold metallo-hydrolase [Ruminococcus sp.]
SDGLLKWAESISGVRKFFINHGDSKSSEIFAQKLRDELNADVYVPYSSAEFDIANGIVTVDAEPRPVPKKSHANENVFYNNLLMSSERLYRLIQNSQGRTNADMRKLTDAINRLCDDWKL